MPAPDIKTSHFKTHLKKFNHALSGKGLQRKISTTYTETDKDDYLGWFPMKQKEWKAGSVDRQV